MFSYLANTLSGRTYKVLDIISCKWAAATSVQSRKEKLGQELEFHKPGKQVPPSPVPDTSTLNRPAGHLETFFKVLGEAGASAQIDHASIFAILQLRFPSHVVDPQTYIARAWETIGRLFPSLRSEISTPDKHKPYDAIVTLRPFSNREFRQTFSVHPNCSNVDELFSIPDLRNGATTCHWLPLPGQVIIKSPHWRSDGFGTVMLSDVFLSILSTLIQDGLDASFDDFPNRPPQASSLSPSIEQLVQRYTKNESNRKDEANSLVDALENGGRTIALPTRPGSDKRRPTHSARTAIRMSANSSDEIIRACRAQGFSVTSAINAAIIRATTQFPQDADANAYAIFAPIDLRGPLMALGAEECSQPTGSYVSGLPLRIEGIMEHSNNGESVPAKSFSTLARELGAFYSQDIQHYKTPGSNTDKTASLLQLASPYMEGISKIFAQHSLPGCPFPKAPVISSFGKMDALIKSEYPKNSDGPASSKLQVTDFWVSCDTATPMITFNPWSWENEMTLSAAWNESFYSTEFACDVLEKTIQELCDGLLIKKASYRKIQSCNDTQKQSL